jgi:hypothetical protein
MFAGMALMDSPPEQLRRLFVFRAERFRINIKRPKIK